MQFFRFLKWPLFGGFGFLILVGAIFVGIRFFTSAPSKSDCELYKALTTEIHASEWGYLEVFKPYILPLDDPHFANRISGVSTVSHRTNEKEVVPAGDGYDSYEIFLTKDIDVNLFSKKWVSTLEDRKSLGKCYKRKERPKISGLTLNALSLREAAKHNGKGPWPNIWQFSEVIKSDDGNYAIIFTNSYCGGLCAWGGFYLLEKSNENWKVVGSHTEWVS